MKYYLKCTYTFQKHFVGILIHILVFVRTLVMFTEVGVIARNRVRCEFLFYKYEYYIFVWDVVVTASHLLCALFI